MNNKGQATMLFSFMLAVTIIVVALGISHSVRQGSDNAMNDMNCTNSTVSDYTKAACYTTDLSPFIFIGTMIAIAGMVLLAKYYFGG